MDGDDGEVYDLSNPEVLAKYKAAADIANRALAHVITLIQPGAVIATICAEGDNFIEAALKTTYTQRGIEKGIAFPTCVSPNECAGHLSPLVSDTIVLQEGDVVKIDLGAHIDGFVGIVGHTVICTADPTVPASGRKSDAIIAAYYAAEAALRLLRPGNKSSQISPVLQQIAEAFHCNLVEGVVSHQIGKFVLEGEKVIPGRVNPEVRNADITFEENEVYALDIMVSSGEGKLRERDARTTVFKRETNVSYSLKMKASKSLFQQVNQRFPALPFSLRSFEDEKTARLGIVECVKHELLRPFPVLYERPTETIAQFKFVVALLPRSVQKLTFSTVMPFVKSDYTIQDPKINAILAMGLKVGASKKAKKKKAKKTPTTTTTTTGAEAAGDKMETE